MPRIIGITGTPGVGKKSVAVLVAKKLDIACIGLNDLALSYGLVNPKGSGKEVDTAAFRRRLRTHRPGPAVIYGHLFPSAVPASLVSRIAVLRCDPSVLKIRLENRGYPPSKVVENVEGELIGLISADSFKAFGPDKSFEVNTTNTSPSDAAQAVADGAQSKESDPGRLDWTLNYDTGEKLRSLLSSGR